MSYSKSSPTLVPSPVFLPPVDNMPVIAPPVVILPLVPLVLGVPDSNGTVNVTLGIADVSKILASGTPVTEQAGTQKVPLFDGYLNVDSSTPAAQAERLYEGILGRHGEAAGLENWSNNLSGGMTLTQVANSFLSSAEYAANGVPVSDVAFVSSLYTSLLGRVPEISGLNANLAFLTSGGSRADVAAGIASSSEAQMSSASTTTQLLVQNTQQGLVYRAYEAGLERDPDQAGLKSWTGNLKAGAQPSDLFRDFTASPEFLTAHVGEDNTAYVQSLYINGLGRSAEDSGLNAFVGALNNGMSRGDVLLSIVNSDEAKGHAYHGALFN